MRKVVLWVIPVAALLLLPSAPGVRGQIVNGGFENWTGGVPNGWITDNFSGLAPISRSTSSHSGTYAMQGSVLNYFNLPVPPIATNLSPISQRYANLTGYYRFTSVGADSFGVVVLVDRQSVPIGAGIFMTGTTVSSYTQFSVPIIYAPDLVPDSCRIQIFIANTDSVHVGSMFLVDNLSFSGMTSSVETVTGVPAKYDLYQNYPNPFNPSTKIQYALPSRSQVLLTVFNSLGQKVTELVQGEQEAGYHEVTFDATGLSSGVYFYRLTTGNFVEVKRMLLVR